MATEEVDPRFADLDAWPMTWAMEAMWEGQLAAIAAVGRALPAITEATNAATEALGDHGRLIYVGAGTSGRVAVQDGAELTPTFAWPQERVKFVMAGGENAFARQRRRSRRRRRRCSQTNRCRASLAARRSDRGCSQRDDAVYRDCAAGNIYRAVTVGVANNRGTALITSAKYPVLIETGPELIAGSRG